MLKSMLLAIILIFAGHHKVLGATSVGVRGETWLLGFGSQVDAAVELARLGVQNPGSVSDHQIELAIENLGAVIEKIEPKLDKYPVSAKSYKYFRHQILNQKALVVFFRNLLILEYNKKRPLRDYASAFRVGGKIKKFS